MPLLQLSSRKSRLTSSDTTGFVQQFYTCLTLPSEVLKTSEWRSWDPKQVSNQPVTELQTNQWNNDLLPSCANLFKTPQVLPHSILSVWMRCWLGSWIYFTASPKTLSRYWLTGYLAISFLVFPTLAPVLPTRKSSEKWSACSILK